jgi:hypothetical protein
LAGLASWERPESCCRQPAPRLFSAPWQIEGLGESLIVKDAGSQPLAYVNFEDAYQRRSSTKRLTNDEARRLALAITRLPALLGRDRAKL